MQDLPVYFDENSTNDIDKICTSIRKLKIKHDINLVLVDYIQDMKGAETEAGIAEIGRKLKNIAKELNIPVIAISQLGRDRNNPEPTISRLRGSGQLEEKADIILLLYRPEYYNKEYSEPHENIPVQGTAQIKIAKGRNIGIGSFILNFNKETTNFYDYIEESDEYDKIIQPKELVDYYSSSMPVNENFDKEDIPF
jgi:replicative DNA helicase